MIFRRGASRGAAVDAQTLFPLALGRIPNSKLRELNAQEVAEVPMATGKIEPFRVEVPVEVLADLRARLSSTRFPDEVPDTGWEYGTNLSYLKELVEYWRTRYDWRAHESEKKPFT